MNYSKSKIDLCQVFDFQRGLTSLALLFSLFINSEVYTYRPNHITQTRGYVWPRPQKQQFRTFVLEVSPVVLWKITGGISKEGKFVSN